MQVGGRLLAISSGFTRLQMKIRGNIVTHSEMCPHLCPSGRVQLVCVECSQSGTAVHLPTE